MLVIFVLAVIVVVGSVVVLAMDTDDRVRESCVESLVMGAVVALLSGGWHWVVGPLLS